MERVHFIMLLSRECVKRRTHWVVSLLACWSDPDFRSFAKLRKVYSSELGHFHSLVMGFFEHDRDRIGGFVI